MSPCRIHRGERFMPFKFLNLNIWDRGNLLDSAIDFIKRENPDIIALQEVSDGGKSAKKSQRILSILQSKLDFDHHFFSPAFFETFPFGKVENGNAIFSRFPIVKKSTLFYDIPYSERSIHETDFTHIPRNLQHAVLKIQNKQVSVFNTQGIWGIDGFDNPRRLAMCQAIAENVRREKYAILSGDFNVDIKTKSVQSIEQHMNNVFKGKLKSSFNMRHKTDPKFAQAVVDMIFVSDSIHVLESYCPKDDVSDHLPLVLVFDF